MPRSGSKARTAPVWDRCCATRARRPFALELLEQVADNQLVYRFPKPQLDGSTQLRLTPLELLERLAALIPPPRPHSQRYHGVLAPSPRSAPEAHRLGPTGNPALVRTAASGRSRALHRGLPRVLQIVANQVGFWAGVEASAHVRGRSALTGACLGLSASRNSR